MHHLLLTHRRYASSTVSCNEGPGGGGGVGGGGGKWLRPQTPRDERHTTLAVHSICGGIHGLTKPRQDEGQGEGGREGKKDEGGGGV